MRIALLVLPFILLLWSYSCSAVKFVCDYADSGKFRTYSGQMMHCAEINIFYLVTHGRFLVSFHNVVRFSVERINPFLCTHMVYNYLKLVEEANQVMIADRITDTGINDKGYEKFVALKEKNPNLKVMIALGGSVSVDESVNIKYSKLVANSTNIDTLVESVITFLERYNFDGISLEWMFPNSTDVAGFNNLIVRLKKAFHPKGLLLGAVGERFQESIDDVGFDFPLLNTNLDFLNVWAVDFHGSDAEPEEANHHAPLYKRPGDATDYNVDFAVNYWIKKGILPEKIVLAVPLFGRSWTLPSQTTSTTPPTFAVRSGAPGKFLKTEGFMAYYEICYAVRHQGWTEFRDSKHFMGPYAVSPTHPRTWVSYDDPAMAVVKSKYVLSKGLGGVFVWDVSFDDYGNICGDGDFPIMRKISQTLDIFRPNTTTPTTSKEEKIGFCECVCD